MGRHQGGQTLLPGGFEGRRGSVERIGESNEERLGARHPSDMLS